MTSTDDGDLSPEAKQFLAAAEAEVERSDPAEPIDLSQIDEIRAQTRAEYEPASLRAIDRHDIVSEQIVVGGIECDRFRSASPLEDRSEQILFYLFGGAFMMGSPFEDLPIIGALAQGTGLTVVAPRYRLAPPHAAPAAGDDAVAAYLGLVDEGTSPVAVAGESAGGNLALLTAQRIRDLGQPLPTVLALLSPGADLRVDDELFAPTRTADPVLHHQRVHDLARAYLPDIDPSDPAVSPALGDLSHLPPTLITTGSRDLLMAGCLRLARLLVRAGVEVDCRVWPGLWHVFEFYDSYPEQAESLSEVVAFIEARI